MALINCPECGRERVSDSAVSCPECGFAIKAYYEKLKKDEAEKRLNEEKEKQRLEYIKKQEHLNIKQEKQRHKNKKGFLGFSRKKVIFTVVTCLAITLVIIIWAYINKEIEIKKYIEANQYDFDETQKMVSELQTYINNIDPDNELDYPIITKEIKNKLGYISMWVFSNDLRCNNDDERIVQSLNSYVNSKTEYNTWDEYKQFLNTNYFIGADNDDSAHKIVDANISYTYIPNSNYIENGSILVASLSHTSSGSNYKIYGTVTNNTYRTVKFVKVKISILDKNGNVIDTDTTYACGSEGLAPGESSKFECYMSKDSRTEKIIANVYDYD